MQYVTADPERPVRRWSRRNTGFRKLGEGATSRPFLCRQDPFIRSREVAIKVALPGSRCVDPARQDLPQAVPHRGVARRASSTTRTSRRSTTRSSSEDAGYIVMEYVAGRHAGAVLQPGVAAAGRADRGDHLQVRARARLRAQAGRHAPRHQAGQHPALPGADRREDHRLRPGAQRSAPRPPRSPASARRPTCRPSRSQGIRSTTAPTSTRSAW